ncbi:ABC transporter permease [Sporolactobacillus sp. Y61]|uniref:ABC transporter permease n=1 Tax=Sporolactobacillus sp. Y61 TaxID=3160863 RepID=A0AAU8IEK0_9BACL|nr:ABC transporter permease [Sporolactobacillus sp. THM19-2]RYL86856.1 ABC transporter permease [Sporolactobacillus sp. THM19-2]
MSGTKLFCQRFRRECRYQWGIIRSVVGWTIMLYIIIPAAAIAPFLYADVWKNIHFYWDDGIPIIFLIALILLFSGHGNVRTCLLDADLLFLIQEKRRLIQLKHCALLVSLFVLIVIEAIVFLLAWPVLTEIYHFSQIEILSLFLLAAGYKLSVMSIRKFTEGTIVRRLCILLAYGAASTLGFTLNSRLWLISGVTCTALMLLLNLIQAGKTNRWFRELEIEHQEHVKFIRPILHFTSGIEKPVSVKRRPLILFRRSGSLFNKPGRENGLLELLLKTFLRHKSYLAAYVQLTGLTCFAVIVLPLWLKWVVYVLFILFMKLWLSILFRKMTASPFFRVVPFDSEIRVPVQSRFQKWLGFPVIMLTGGVTLMATLVL